MSSAFLFDEPVTFTRIFWLSIIIAGVIWLKVADSPKLEKKGHSAAGAAHDLETR